MILFKNTAQLTAYMQKARNGGNAIGFCPTMGALHEGHLSLIKASRQDNQLTVASIFVNPAQFNDEKDFEKYPVTIEKDIEWLVSAGCQVLFLPSTNEVYPDGYSFPSHFDLGYLDTILEGRYRPGHFQGVCKVMSRLLEAVQPDNLYMGQKDYQQCIVIKRLLGIMHLPVSLHTCPTLRAADGLALSSRNTRLHEWERNKAVTIFLTLKHLKENIVPGPVEPLLLTAHALLTLSDCKVDYVAIADAGTLEPVSEWNGKQKIIALVAAFQGEVRLIDNMLLN